MMSYCRLRRHRRRDQARGQSQSPDQWPQHLNRDQLLSIPSIPKTLIVVGGGIIGVEYACMFATASVRVIIVEKRPRLLEFADAEVVEAQSYHIRDRRATIAPE